MIIQDAKGLIEIAHEHETKVRAHDNGVNELVRVYGADVPPAIKAMVKEERENLIADGVAINMLTIGAAFPTVVIPPQFVLPVDIEEVL